MPFESEFLDLMPDSIEIKLYSGVNAYGESTHNPTLLALKCHLEYGVERVVTLEGEEKVVQGRAYLPGVFGVRPLDRIILPGGIERGIAQVLINHDESGPHHEVVLFT